MNINIELSTITGHLCKTNLSPRSFPLKISVDKNKLALAPTPPTWHDWFHFGLHPSGARKNDVLPSFSVIFLQKRTQKKCVCVCAAQIRSSQIQTDNIHTLDGRTNRVHSRCVRAMCFTVYWQQWYGQLNAHCTHTHTTQRTWFEHEDAALPMQTTERTRRTHPAVHHATF